MSQREDDLELLGKVLDLSLQPRQREAFEDMLDHRASGRYPLSDKQRKWAEGLLDEPKYENLVSSGKAPRGREVEMASVLQNLPKRPPQRRRDDGE